MRSLVLTLLAMVPVAGLLSGCAMSPTGSTVAAGQTADNTTASLSGKAFGGQQPVIGATIAVYSYGTAGYGSTGTLLGTTTTGAGGDFNLTYACSSSSAPVYALSIGGTNGYGSNSNSAIVEGAALGTCGSSEVAPFIVINEITTAVLATSFSHFFSNLPSTDITTNDHFGSPADLNTAIARVNDVLIPAVLDISDGYPNNSSSTFTIEGSKIVTIGNILANCVNSTGPASYPCTVLFADTTDSNGNKPTNVLEAAVNMAKNPTANIQQLFGLSGSGAFAGGLTAYPTDWTLAVSYTNPALGLGVDTHTVSTLDIDNSGRVWFPSNQNGAVGVAYFDPGALNFSSVYTAPGMVRPEQIAIDINGTVWASDLGSDVVAGFPSGAPGTPVVLTMPGTTSTALTVLDNDNLRVGVLANSTTYPGLALITDNNGSSYTYKAIPFSTISSPGYFLSSLAGDSVGGSFFTLNYAPGNNYTYGFYFDPLNNLDFAISQTQDLNQTVFTGTDYVAARGGLTSVAGDGLCIFSKRACYSMQTETARRHPSGMVIDGGAGLWLADNATPSVEFIPYNGTTYLDVNNVPANQIYVHGPSNGGTMVSPTGVGVDNTGNVWVSNAGCYGVSCTTSSAFILTEIIGAGTPTINPVSAQVVLGTRGGAGMEPQ